MNNSNLKLQFSLTITGLVLVIAFACNKNDARPDVNAVIRIEAVVPSTVYLIKNNSVLLNASVTRDLYSGVSLFYYWNCPIHPSGVFPRIISPNDMLTGVDRLSVGKYVFTLSVGDNLGNVSFREFNMQVLPDTLTNSLLAKSIAGPDQIITLPQDWIILDGRGSYDVNPKGRELQFTWEVVGRPNGSNAIQMTNYRQDYTRANEFAAGNYLFQLTVMNEFGSKSLDTVEIKVLPDPIIGTSRIYDNVEWGFYVDEDGVKINQADISEPDIFEYRSLKNTEITFWNDATQEWTKLEHLFWYGSKTGLILTVSSSVVDLVGKKMKVRARFF